MLYAVPFAPEDETEDYTQAVLAGNYTRSMPLDDITGFAIIDTKTALGWDPRFRAGLVVVATFANGRFEPIAVGDASQAQAADLRATLAETFLPLRGKAKAAPIADPHGGPTTARKSSRTPRADDDPI